MSCYDERLRELQQKVTRKNQLDAMLKELYARQRTLRQRADELREQMISEQADVDRLENGSLAAFFYNVVGKMDQQLDKERREAYAAKVKYDAAAAELSALEEDIGRKEREYASLQNCREEYDRLLQEKGEELKRSGSREGRRLLELEQKIAYMEDQERELGEAITAGQYALDTADRVLSELGGANSWAMIDIFTDSVLSDIAKYSKLDRAQRMIEQLQIQLQSFRTELADVTIWSDIQINVGGFMQFADFFFDNIFTDWMVRDQIARSLDQVQDTRYQIVNVLNRLEELLGRCGREKENLRGEMDRLVRETGSGALGE